jgi:hypothetical protein
MSWDRLFAPIHLCYGSHSIESKDKNCPHDLIDRPSKTNSAETTSEAYYKRPKYTVPLWTSSGKSFHKNWLSRNDRPHHMSVLSSSTRGLSMVIGQYCGSQPGLLAVKFDLLARRLSKSRLGGRGKGEQASGPTFVWELNAYRRQQQVMIHRIAQWHIIARNKITKIKLWAHSKLNMKWWIWFVQWT